MPTAEFQVFFDGQKAGDLHEGEAGAIGFRYDPLWMKSGFAISHSLPFRKDPYRREAHLYFSNLLPEGDVRTAVSNRLGISAENDFALLVALGGDCAGALTVGREPRQLESQYEKISRSRLATRIAHGETLLSSLQDKAEDIRFSLAGAQDKLPVYMKGKDIHLPKGNSSSTHILKPQNRRFPHVPDNECLMNSLARGLGLDVAATAIIQSKDLRACLIERYDRIIEEKRVQRLHQEDFCQALGVSHRAKYEKSGGPTFVDAYNCVAANSARLPEDLERLVKWLIFNVAIGNCDGHAKNLSFLRNLNGDWILSPHYDFVSTRVYPRVSKTLAMSIGGSNDSGTITGTHWKKLAHEIKFGPNLMLELVREITESAPDQLTSTASEFQKKYGASPLIQPLRKIVHAQSRRLISLLKK